MSSGWRDSTQPMERRKGVVTHEDIAAIHHRLDLQDKILNDIRDAVVFAKVGTRIIKWCGAIGAAGVAIWQAWKAFKGVQ